MKKALLFLLTLILLCAVSAGIAEDTCVTVQVELTYRYDMTEVMLDSINEFRTGPDAWYWNSDNTEKVTDLGLEKLTYDYGLEKVAMQRAAECAVHYAHTRPNGKSCFTIYPMGGCAENIAAGYSTTAAVFTAWREDDDDYSGQGHRRNMLSDYCTHIGIGCVYADGRYFWCQAFGAEGTGEAKSSLKGPARIETSVQILVTDGMTNQTVSADSLKINEGESADVPTVSGNSGGWGSTKITVIDPPWTVADPEVVSVDDGKVNALKGGRTTMKVNLGDELMVEVTSVCKNHTWVIDPAVAPTCTEGGVTEGKHCSVCGEVQIPQQPLDALGHDWDEGVITKEATYTEDGTKTFTCRRCGETREEIISIRIPLGQTGWVKNPDGTWSYGNENGDAVVGVMYDGGTMYCFNENGKMISGWGQVGEKWYYAEPSGAVAHNCWKKIGGSWYCFRADGEMATGWVHDGGWYYMKPDGSMATGWVEDEGEWYYFKNTGELYTGWLKSENSWYLLKPSGEMAVGWYKSGGVWYYFRSSGAMATGWVEEKDDNGETVWYWFDNDGIMATGWKLINGTWEMFADSGEWLYTWNGQ